jgi:branched-chain amino acid transport system substrate-binding protein
MKLRRRTVLKSILGAGVRLGSIRAPAVLAASGSLKIGLLTVTSGPLAQGGYQMRQGIDAFLKEKSGRLGGLATELIAADTGGNPQTAKTKLMELVERDHVDVVLGPFAAFELLAISDYVRQTRIPLITTATAEDITQRHRNPWIVRTSSSSAQTPHAMADYCAKQLNLKRVATIANDFAFGYEQCGGFQRVFEDDGGKVAKKVWPPVVTPDFLPFITQIRDYEGIFNGLGGGNPVRFLQTYASLGLHQTMTGGWSLLDEPLLKSLGDEALGIYTAHWYTPSYASESNARFVAAMHRDYGELPGGGAAGMYVAGQIIDAALRTLKGDIQVKASVMAAIQAATLADTPRGPFAFDGFGNAVGPVFIRKCERRDGKLVNTVVKTYERVSQFWTYDQKWFLSQPVYSRDYPPLKT